MVDSARADCRGKKAALDLFSGGRGESVDVSRTYQQRHRAYQRARSAWAGGRGTRRRSDLCARQENSRVGGLARETYLGSADIMGRSPAGARSGGGGGGGGWGAGGSAAGRERAGGAGGREE